MDEIDLADLRVDAVSAELRDELLRRVLGMLEAFNDEHGLELDLIGRLDLLDHVLTDYAEWLKSALLPTH
jgi:hypothetical protein